MKKVKVLQVEEAKFLHRLSWWSNWVDVCVFDYGASGHLTNMNAEPQNVQ